jgi:serine protease Do
MRHWTWLALALVFAATSAEAADYKILRHMNAPAPTVVTQIETAKVQPVQLARVVVHPQDGEAWALAYTSIAIREEGDNRPANRFLTWKSGAVDGDLTAFQRVFDDELKKAGFKSDGGGSLFGEGESSANLKVGVLIDDIRGRFCVDCPNLYNRSGIPATVMMNANWEVYSSLERKVIAKVTTNGGADFKGELHDSVIPAVLEGFRENARQLLSSEAFRNAVSRSDSPPQAAAAARTVSPIKLVAGSSRAVLAEASKSVAVVFSADGSGSGFLISTDGYLLTNRHVVGASKYVKIKWSDGAEVVGEVIRSDPRRDVALIKADPQGRAPLALRSAAVQQGEAVYAIGAPLGEKFQNTMTKGIVSATRVEGGLPFIQSDVAVTHGNSGGPLLDDKGQVIGMTVYGRLDDNGLPVSLTR